MTESNFISESDFEKLLDSIPNQSNGNTKLNQEDWKWFFRLQYRCAFRPIEELRLKPEDFDCKFRIVTMPVTKTGFKHCKCSKWEREYSQGAKKCVSVDKDCKKCFGRGKFSIPQKTTIHPWDAKDLEKYLETKHKGELIWPIGRKHAWTKFKQLCELAGLSYRWEKQERTWNDTQYLLRSSREKIMEDLGAKPSIMDLKMRHKPKTMGDTYRQRTIHDLLAWEQEAYAISKEKIHV